MNFARYSTFFLAISTALFSINGISAQSAKSKPEYLNGVTNDDSSKIYHNLIRTAFKSGFPFAEKYRITALPITIPLKVAGIKQDAYKEGLSNEEIQKKINSEISEINKCTCFSINISSRSSSEAVNLRYWGANLYQNGKSYPVRFENPSSMASVLRKRTYYTNSYGQSTSIHSYDEVTYDNSGYLCTSPGETIDFTQSFVLRLQPRFEKDLEPVSLVWSDKPVKRHGSLSSTR